MLLLPGVAAASPPPVAARPALAFATPGAEPGLSDECARLRVALDRANAEITALKRVDRGVRDDYRLRQKMADAEDLARRLTTAEAELRRLRGQPTPALPSAAGSPEAPGVLQARADLLSDQAHKLADQAAVFARAAGQMRTRQTLRRRAGQVERDPFASMDGSKRMMLVQGSNRTFGTATGDGKRTGESNATNGTPTTATTANPGSSAPPAGGSTTLAPQAGDKSATGPTPSVPTPVAGQPEPTAASLTVLDPTTMAELRKMEVAAGHPMTEVERLERAAAALSGKARALEGEARVLRDQASKR